MNKSLIYILFSFFFTNCVCQKDINPPVLEIPPPIIKTRLDVVNLYFWWEIIEKEGLLYDKKNNAVLEDGMYSINVNNCIVSNDIITRTGDINKKGEIKKGKYLNTWVYVYQKGTLKIENYNYNGLLNDDYIVYDKNKSIEYKTVFKNGTGYYKNYCLRLKKIKEEGNYINGKKNGEWIFYNEEGNETKKYYKAGKLIER